MLRPPGHADFCRPGVQTLDLTEFAAQGYTWFHGVITDVYPVTDLGSTYSILNSLSHRWDGNSLLLPLDECRLITPQYRVRLQIIDSLGDEVPEQVHAVVQDMYLSSSPTWNGPGIGGHDEFTWEGDSFAIGQHIGGHLVWSSRFEVARIHANPAIPLFLVREDGTIAFQALDGHLHDDFCYGIDAAHVLEQLDGMNIDDFMKLLADHRADPQAVGEERLDEIRRLGPNHGGRINDDIAANSFFPTCTPSDAVYLGSNLR